MLEAILHPLTNWVTAAIGDYGLFAIFGLMLLESTGVPIPSEAISPFAGYLVFLEKMGLFGAISAGVLGNLMGSWIARQVVAGVTPGKRGEEYEDVPVFNTVDEAIEETGANASIIFVPPPLAADAIFEALDSEIRTVCCITEGVPVHDMMRVANYLRVKDATLIGPNCPGVLSPGKSNVSIMPADIFAPGSVGVVSRSGTLTYQIVDELTQNGTGQSTAVGIGGDPIIGTDFIEILKQFEADPETECAVMIGEIGGNAEQLAAEYVQSEMRTPVVAYIAGFTAPEGKTMGHAGAIVSGGEDTAEAKSEALERAGIRAATNPSEVAQLVTKALDS